MYFVLDRGDKGKGAPIHLNGDLLPLCVHNGTGAVVIVLHHAKQRHMLHHGAAQSLLHHAHLPFAAVQQDQVRQRGKLIALMVGPFAHSGKAVFLGPARKRFGHAGVIIGARHRAHFKAAVTASLGFSVFKHHHAAHTGAVAPVGNIIAFNGARCFGKAQKMCQLFQQLLLPAEAPAFSRQALYGVGVGHAYQLGHIAALRHIQLHIAAAGLAERLRQRLGPFGQLVHGDQLGHLLAVQIILGQKGLAQGRNIRGIAEQEFPLIRKAAFPIAQNGRAHRLGGARKSHHIHGSFPIHPHFLPGRNLLNGTDLIAQQRRGFKIQPFRGFHHFGGQGFYNISLAVADHVFGIFYCFTVGFLADLAAAHGHTFANVCVQAGAALADLLREFAAAARQQKGILCGFHHFAHRKAAGKRAKIAGTVLFFLQHSRKAGPRLLTDAHIRIALIIF